LTALVKKDPADLEQVLAMLHRLKSGMDFTLLDEALSYAVFLVDVNKLYEVALGMYDLNLAVLVAQKSQKDPKEYLTFVNELKSMKMHYQRFKIDDYLKRYEKAIENLSQAGNSFRLFLIAYSFLPRVSSYMAELTINYYRG
jgi:elongator complex protein 1